MAAARREIVTDIPPSRPTIVPAFELGQIARNAEVRAEVMGDMVYEVVPDLSWAELGLDLNEQLVLGHIDGILPVDMIECVVSISRDELHSILCVLRARGIIVPGELMPRSGMLTRYARS